MFVRRSCRWLVVLDWGSDSGSKIMVPLGRFVGGRYTDLIFQ